MTPGPLWQHISDLRFDLTCYILITCNLTSAILDSLPKTQSISIQCTGFIKKKICKCAVPEVLENIVTLPMDGHWKLGGGAGPGRGVSIFTEGKYSLRS